jgi:2-keto-4-pentenoate hydratase/2-oxohepta-3-ene-1,7-dioic acid hydratase in catechol pathway
MKLGHFKEAATGKQRLGALVGDKVIDLARLALAVQQAGGSVTRWVLELTNMPEVIRRGAEARAELQDVVADGLTRGIAKDDSFAFSPDSLSFLPPVYPSKIVAIGRNYVDHAIEGGEAPPPAPLIFAKLPNSLSAHGAPIMLPAISSQVDYEAELAVIIGRRTKRVSEADALNYVFGYTLINDVSARDLQFGDGQWIRGKGLDGFAPLGPFITTRDEIDDVQTLDIEGRLNGQVMQSSNTSKMIFKVPFLISYISQGITLEPGDVIATGTPDGVGIFRKPPILLKPGDVYEVTVQKLGTLRNHVVEQGN